MVFQAFYLFSHLTIIENIMLAQKEKTLADPRGFIVDLLYKEGMHLKQNKAFVNSESDTINYFNRSS